MNYKAVHTKRDAVGPAVPGVQKIKAALRQTRRLLAKVRYFHCSLWKKVFNPFCLYFLQDNLAADVRVATERKQRALEIDLAEAERTRKERALAQRYHKVKFFGESYLIFAVLSTRST